MQGISNTHYNYYCYIYANYDNKRNYPTYIRYYKRKKDAEELRQFIECCVTYKRYKIYSINEQKAGDPEAYYEEHDKQLDAFHDAQFALEQRNIDVSSITAESIKIMQKRLKDTEEEIRLQEEILQQNERDQKLLSEYQKEIDTYLGVKKNEI